MTITISIIIPVYNTAKYLPRCLDSIIDQVGAQPEEVEIIAVNDCSTDNSADILFSYAHRSKALKVVNLENNVGAASARNIGLDIAEGEYVIFADSDDSYETGAFKKILSVIDKYHPDYIKFMHKKLTENGDIIQIRRSDAAGIFDIRLSVYDRKAVFRNIILNMMCCNGCYKRSLIGSIRFDPKYKISEDSLFALMCATKATLFYIIDEPLYRYYWRASSLTNRISDDAVVGLLELTGHYYNLCASMFWFSDVACDTFDRLWGFVRGWYYNIVISDKHTSAKIRSSYLEAVERLLAKPEAETVLGYWRRIIIFISRHVSIRIIGVYNFIERIENLVRRISSLLIRKICPCKLES